MKISLICLLDCYYPVDFTPRFAYVGVRSEVLVS